MSATHCVKAEVASNGSEPQSPENYQKADGYVKDCTDVSNHDDADAAPPAFNDKKRKITIQTREMRLEQNRKAARESRKRKKVLVEELQRSVIFFSRANNLLKKQNNDLQRLLIQVQTQIGRMNSGKDLFRQLCSGSAGASVSPWVVSFPMTQPAQGQATPSGTQVQVEMTMPSATLDNNTSNEPSSANNATVSDPNVATDGILNAPSSQTENPTLQKQDTCGENFLKQQHRTVEEGTRSGNVSSVTGHVQIPVQQFQFDNNLIANWMNFQAAMAAGATGLSYPIMSFPFMNPAFLSMNSMNIGGGTADTSSALPATPGLPGLMVSSNAGVTNAPVSQVSSGVGSNPSNSGQGVPGNMMEMIPGGMQNHFPQVVMNQGNNAPIENPSDGREKEVNLQVGESKPSNNL